MIYYAQNETMGEVGAAWNVRRETFGKKYISCGIQHTNISARKVYANLCQRKDAKIRLLPCYGTRVARRGLPRLPH